MIPKVGAVPDWVGIAVGVTTFMGSLIGLARWAVSHYRDASVIAKENQDKFIDQISADRTELKTQLHEMTLRFAAMTAMLDEKTRLHDAAIDQLERVRSELLDTKAELHEAIRQIHTLRTT